MHSIIPLGILGSVLAVVLTLYRRFTKDWESAKRTGLVCIPTRKYNLDISPPPVGTWAALYCFAYLLSFTMKTKFKQWPGADSMGS